MNSPQKVAIIGGSGAGKTRLGQALAERIGADFIEVDGIQHKAGWQKASDEEIRRDIQAAIEDQAKWVIDGTCEREVGDYISSRTDLTRLRASWSV